MFSYCAYQGCTNQNLPCSKITFFSLPRDKRRKIWLENSGNPGIQNLGDKTVKLFCENHFDSKFIRRQFSRNLLHKDAVPFQYTEDEQVLKIQDQYYVISCTNTDSDDKVDEEDSTVASNLLKSIKIIKSNETLDNNSNEDHITSEDEECVIASVYSKVGNESEKLIQNKETDYRVEESNETSDHEAYDVSSVKSGRGHKRKSNLRTKSNNEKKQKIKALINSYDNESTEEDLVCQDQETIENQEIEIELISEFETVPHLKKISNEYENVKNSDHISNKSNEEDNNGTSAKVISEIENTENQTLGTRTNSQSSMPSVSDPKDSSNSNQKNTTQNTNDYEEDKHFALSLVGYFQRLSHRKKALAKLKILQYLTELEFNEDES